MAIEQRFIKSRARNAFYVATHAAEALEQIALSAKAASDAPAGVLPDGSR